jgi:hypothetical protein
MDSTAQNTTQPISDDQELARALADVLDDPVSDQGTPAVAAASVTTDASQVGDSALSFEETPAPHHVAHPVTQAAPAPSHQVVTPAASPVQVAPAAPIAPVAPVAHDVPAPQVSHNAPAEPIIQDANDLATLKETALIELRPLMDKVELPADEKFNTYLMLIRSTDDPSLVGPAHHAALGISDEKSRATALLEIIKEIDYLSNPDKSAL